MLSPYIDGQLSPGEKDRVEEHIESCDACRRELESLRATVKLLHRVPVVSPPRSFTLAEVVPKRRAVALGALRVATAVAVIVLAFFFVGDALHLFDGGLIAERYAQQLAPNTEGISDTGGAPAESSGYAWPVDQIELALTGVALALAGMTAILWQRQRRRVKQTLRSRSGPREGGR